MQETFKKVFYPLVMTCVVFVLGMVAETAIKGESYMLILFFGTHFLATLLFLPFFLGFFTVNYIILKHKGRGFALSMIVLAAVVLEVFLIFSFVPTSML